MVNQTTIKANIIQHILNNEKEIKTKQQINKTINEYAENFEKQLNENYTLVNPEELLDFIYRNTKFIDFLIEIVPSIKEVYPDNELTLELSSDPEIDNYEQVTLAPVIPKNNDTRNDLKNLEKLHNKLRPLIKQHNVFYNFIIWVNYQ